MKTIYLLSCCKQKLSFPAEARELYQSTGFKKSLAYAQSQKPDAIYILSAKHHLVTLTEVLAPYDVCLNDKSLQERKEWSIEVLKELSVVSNLQEDKFIILAGKNYYSELINGLVNYELPLEGLPLGSRLQWFDEHTRKMDPNSACLYIHEWVNKLPRYTWPFDSSAIPENGIYFFFEKGEKYHGMDRIVRIGSHTGDNNLVTRLEEHLDKENKDRSIFRKNIGRAFLNKAGDPFLDFWNIDLTTLQNREKNKLDAEKKIKLFDTEKTVSEYMRKNLSFACIPIDSRDERLSYEAYLTQVVSSADDFKPSENWLGLYSPVEKIKKSGLWLVNNLFSASNGCLEQQNHLYTRRNNNLSVLMNFLDVNQNGYCDDCLSRLTHVCPRQQVNQLCNNNADLIVRIDSGRCWHCGKIKILRRRYSQN